jgi:hypothetical protein
MITSTNSDGAMAKHHQAKARTRPTTIISHFVHNENRLIRKFDAEVFDCPFLSGLFAMTPSRTQETKPLDQPGTPTWAPEG